jgi:hypothetical protein
VAAGSLRLSPGAPVRSANLDPPLSAHHCQDESETPGRLRLAPVSGHGRDDRFLASPGVAPGDPYLSRIPIGLPECILLFPAAGHRMGIDFNGNPGGERGPDPGVFAGLPEIKSKNLFTTEHTESKIRNSKHEIRNKHERSKFKFSKQMVSNFEFVSDFDIRIWIYSLCVLCDLCGKKFFDRK